MGLAALALLLVGCTGVGGTDDELTPRPTPTVTVTGPAQQRLPQQLDLAGEQELSEQVVWSTGSTVRLGGAAVDLAPLVPERMVVLPRGLLVLADGELWFVSGQVVRGLPLPPVGSLEVSADGSQLLVGATDREETVAYSLEGALVDPGAVADPRSQRRVVRGPGVHDVVPAADGVRVSGPRGGLLPVADLPADLDVRGWTGPTGFYGVTRAGQQPPGLVSCTTQAPARCEELGEVEPDRLDELVLALHPGG